MKITELEILRVPPSWVWLRIHTNEGVTGLGEPYLEDHPEAVIAEVRRLEPVLIGRDPRRIEELWKAMYEQVYYYRGGPITMSAISGIDMALWDIAGKAAGLPVYEMLGGACRDRIRMYAGVVDLDPYSVEPGNRYYNGGAHAPLRMTEFDPAAWAEASRRWVEEWGFTCIKLHPPPGYGLEQVTDIDEIAAIVEAVRSMVGPKVDIAVDLHHPHPNVAMQLIDTIEPCRPIFVEDPQQLERLDDLARIVRSTPVAIAAGAGWMGKWPFFDAVSAGLTVVQPDLAHAGGITECKKIAAIAEAGYGFVALHCPNSIVQLAASIQLDACLPNFLVQEHNSVVAFREDGRVLFGKGYIVDPFELGDDGCVAVPKRPGLGIELDDEGLSAIMAKPWSPLRA